MNIIKPHYDIYYIPDSSQHDSVLKYLEGIGRICYKSEDKITIDSYLRYLNMLKENKHWAMLEHYVFVLDIPEWIYFDINHTLTNANLSWEYMEKSHYIRASYYYTDEGKARYILSSSATGLNYLNEYQDFNTSKGIKHVCEFMHDKYPEIINDPGMDHFDPDIRFIGRDELQTLPVKERMLHEAYTVKFTVSRGFTHELVRHRPASYAQESTRYVNFSKEKYGSEIALINPTYLEEDNDALNIWTKSMLQIESAYMDLIKLGHTPQEARSVLPNSTKTEIVMTARLGEWKHVFNMRADKPAHPEMKEIMYPLLNDTMKTHGECFKDIEWRIEEGIKDGWIHA